MVGTPLTSYSPAKLSNLATLHHSLSLEDTVDFQTTWLGWYCFWFYLEYPVFLLLIIKSLTHFLDSMSNFTYSMKYFSYLPSCVFCSQFYILFCILQFFFPKNVHTQYYVPSHTINCTETMFSTSHCELNER